MKLRFLLPVSFTLMIIFLFWYTRIFAFKLYPVIMDFSFFALFFSSLFMEETVIQKIARTMEGGELSDFSKKYTRNLTYIWCVFLFANFLIALSTVFMADKIWMLYNGCISYLAVGTFFIIEYIIRIIMKKKYE